MTRPRAGYVGFTRTPTSTAASGIWTLREAEASKRAAAWPDTRPDEGSDPFYSSVVLLLHADGTGSAFVDSSPYARTITAVGGATQSTAQSKWGGKSLALNGSDANLSLPSSALAFTGDFVIEGWIYLISNPTYSSIVETRASPSFADFVAGVYPIGGGHRLDFVTAGGVRLTGSSTSVPLGSWSHFAFVRSSGVISAYVDGVRDATQLSYSASISPASATALIGRNVDGNFINGYIDDLRITVGSARGYTGSTITVPTAAFPEGAAGSDPFFSSVALLLHMEGSGATFTDSSSVGRSITASGGSTQSTAQSRFGSKSWLSDGSGDHLTFGGGSTLTMGTGDFTIEMWLRLNSYAQASLWESTPIGGSGSRSTGFIWYIVSGGTVHVYHSGSNILSTSSAIIPLSQWSHVALSRASGTTRMYVDGSQVASTASSYNDTAAGGAIGAFCDGGSYSIDGYIDEVRVTRGVARYSGSTLTVPAAAFPDAPPAESGGGTPAFAVSGAGTAAANGTYCESGTLNGRPRYIYGSYTIEYTSDWMINDEGYGPNWLIRFGSTDLYYASVTNATPPLSGWGVGSGGSPAPTLSSTTC